MDSKKKHNSDAATESLSPSLSSTPFFQLHKPRAPLSNFIEMFWYCETPTVSAPLLEHVLPTGTVEFVIRLTKDSTRVFNSANNESSYNSFSGSVITGAQSRYFVLDKSEQDTLLGIHFKPGGAFPFFKIPANDLQNVHVSLEDLWERQSARCLREELLHESSVQGKFEILERCLLHSVHRPLEHHPALEFALHQLQQVPCAYKLSELADEVGLSQRRFIQLFSQQVGLTPKVFGRVTRFQKVIQGIQSFKEINWSDVALACGYFDQAHFIHEFQEFAGLAPSVYAALRTDQLNHVPLNPQAP